MGCNCDSSKFWIGLGIGTAFGVLAYYLSKTVKAKQMKAQVLTALEELEVVAMDKYDCAKQIVKEKGAKVAGQVAVKAADIKAKLEEPDAE